MAAMPGVDHHFVNLQAEYPNQGAIGLIGLRWRDARQPCRLSVSGGAATAFDRRSFLPPSGSRTVLVSTTVPNRKSENRNS